MGENRNAYRILVGKPEGKRPLGRPRRRWVDNFKMDLREIGSCEYGIELSDSIKCWEFLLFNLLYICFLPTFLYLSLHFFY
jgi:hypothetical protein